MPLAYAAQNGSAAPYMGGGLTFDGYMAPEFGKSARYKAAPEFGRGANSEIGRKLGGLTFSDRIKYSPAATLIITASAMALSQISNYQL